MTTLLIDLGNTALKWTPIEEPDNPHTIIHKGSTHFKEELYDLWLNMRPKRIIGCTVAAPVVAFSLTKFFNDHGIRWNWVRTQPSFHGRMTLNNCYENPGQLGADRWYAAVGAADAMLEERRSLLVVHTGTATTVDSILYRESGVYDFMGGRNTLGPTLMKTFLTKGIPSLTDLDGAYDALPRSTRDAVMTGIIDAQVGLILRARSVMRRQGFDPKVLLAGGSAKFIAPYLQEEVPDLIVKHNLVLRGLSALAGQQAEGLGREDA